ncbi:OTU domain-containing protein 4-like [Dendronephthya gigantea]|uniref:OTU domain-containing protein 4-like n=1 Tax=Dendronephthya gigantea TaxID=151771 RepID=UPI0010696FE6|nr:OTU domain-containing protein 4-like [Dendronephthya gigantea]
MLSGDIERNPGPILSNLVLEQRLRCFQLGPFDVGGDGDCFFRAVSHQLYGDPGQHLEVRAAGIAYLRDNPERFIESNTENSWLEYLNNMSMQGTWGDAMIIQAVADQLKLKIIIAETHEGFSEYSIIQPVSSRCQLTNVYLGHIDEYHYVSTLPCTSIQGACHNELLTSRIFEISSKQLTESSQAKQVRTEYTKAYMKRKRANETHDPEAKEKKRQYMRDYRKHKQISERLLPSTKSLKAKQKKRLYAKEYRRQKREFQSLQSLISEFHDIVSQDY